MKIKYENQKTHSIFCLAKICTKELQIQTIQVLSKHCLGTYQKCFMQIAAAVSNLPVYIWIKPTIKKSNMISFYNIQSSATTLHGG